MALGHEKLFNLGRGLDFFITKNLLIFSSEFKSLLSLSTFQYEVEVYQRIEKLLGYKLDVYPTVKEEALVLEERIAEAERFAKLVSILHISWVSFQGTSV